MEPALQEKELGIADLMQSLSIDIFVQLTLLSKQEKDKMKKCVPALFK